jgi:hypothetical protein
MQRHVSASVSTVDRSSKKLTPDPRHFNTPNRPVCQLRCVLQRPKTLYEVSDPYLCWMKENTVCRYSVKLTLTSEMSSTPSARDNDMRCLRYGTS